MKATRVGTVEEALRAHPARYFVSRWPPRALAYVASGIPIGLLTLVWLPVSAVLGLGVLMPVATWPLGMLERRRITLLGEVPLPDPHAAPAAAGLWPWLRARYVDPATWRELAYAVLQATVLLVLDIAACVIAVVGPGTLLTLELVNVVIPGRKYWVLPYLAVAVMVVIPVGVLAVTFVAAGHGAVARNLLGPVEDDRVRTLTRSRARLLDAFEAERLRIERDLHDGAQQRLVALSMTLGLAELERDDPEATHALVTRAAEQSRAALAELRALVRGIHPRVLTDLGLPAAVAELAQGCGVPLTISLDLPRRLPPAVESAAYFVAAEAVTNIVRHAGATRAWITGTADASRLVIEVGDDGVGGADPARGTGLTGLADRVDALAGTLTMFSPVGGPTLLRLELPCSA